jgi:Ca2+-binding RTX toxin-like protein
MTLINGPAPNAHPSGDLDTVDITSTGVALSLDPNLAAFDSNGYTGLAIYNYGAIHGAPGGGPGAPGYGLVFSSGSTGSIFNGAHAEIAGYTVGALLDSGGVSFQNLGTVKCYGSPADSAAFMFGANAFDDSLDNKGLIQGGSYGIYDFSNGGGNQIKNEGTVAGTVDGLHIFTGLGELTEITNYGTIKGGSAAIDIVAGGLSMTNNGHLIGGLDLRGSGGTPNTISNSGIIKGSVFLGSGNDLFTGGGRVTGAIYAGAGNDAIEIDKGKAVIHVGTGNSTLIGGSGHDKFIFDSSIGGHVDEITKFKDGKDRIVLSEADFAGLGPHGTLHAGHFHLNVPAGSAPQIVYVKGDGFLYYDAGGTTIHFATLTSHPAIHSTDFLVTA